MKKSQASFELLKKKIPLGQISEQPDSYDPRLLVSIPRGLARDAEGIKSNFFKGHDLWRCWEVSWLNPNGRPEVRVGQLIVPSDSPNICESKSLKLFLNSLANEVFKSDIEAKNRIVNDLTPILGVMPSFDLFSVSDSRFLVGSLDGICLDHLAVNVAVYTPNADLLQVDPHARGKDSLFTHLFRSNCPVTNQPDWATVFVEYESKRRVYPESLLAYLISYRGHIGFHEACVERIFRDLMELLDPEELTVWAGFMRRGGLDINPVRSLESTLITPPRLARH